MKKSEEKKKLVEELVKLSKLLDVVQLYHLPKQDVTQDWLAETAAVLKNLDEGDYQEFVALSKVIAPTKGREERKKAAYEIDAFMRRKVLEWKQYDFSELNGSENNEFTVNISTKGKKSSNIKKKKFNLGLVITILIAILAIVVAIVIYKNNKDFKQAPFFDYSYDGTEKIFKVRGNENIKVVKANWFLAGKWPFDENNYTLQKINNLDKDLGWYEIRDAYGEVLVNTLQDWGKDVIECEFFRLTQDTIPVMVVVSYDTKENSKLENKDLLLITRMDTERPNPQMILRNVENDEIINNFFNENIWQIESATEHISENYEYSNEEYSGNLRTYTGKCGVLMNQPLEGY